MNIRAQLGISESNTPATALGSIVFHDLPRVPIAVQMTTLNLGGHLSTNVLLEAYAGNKIVEAFCQLPGVVMNCDQALRVMLMYLPLHFIQDTLAPMVEAICEAVGKPVFSMFDELPANFRFS